MILMYLLNKWFLFVFNQKQPQIAALNIRETFNALFDNPHIPTSLRSVLQQKWRKNPRSAIYINYCCLISQPWLSLSLILKLSDLHNLTTPTITFQHILYSNPSNAVCVCVYSCFIVQKLLSNKSVLNVIYIKEQVHAHTHT